MRAPAATMLVPAARAAVRPEQQDEHRHEEHATAVGEEAAQHADGEGGHDHDSAARSRQAAARSAWSAASGSSTRAPTTRRSTPGADEQRLTAQPARAERAEHRAGDAAGHDEPGEAGVEVAGAQLAAGREDRRGQQRRAAAWRPRWRRGRRRGPASAWRRRRHPRRRARTPCRRRRRRAGSADRARPDPHRTSSQKSKTCFCRFA